MRQPGSQPGSNPQADRYAWVDFAKGFCIVAVVTMWVAGTMTGHTPNGKAGWLGYFVAFARPFRMPDFFLISGLFLSRVIDRPWKSYLDTKVVHYLYFFVLWTFIVVPITWLLGYDTPATPGEALQSLLYQLYDPFGMLWFIMMLSVYFVVTRLLRDLPVWLVLPVAIALLMVEFNTGIYHVDQFGMFFGYFYAGHVFASRFFALADWVDRHRWQAVGVLAAWAVFNAVIVKLGWSEEAFWRVPLGFLGICAVVMLARLVAFQPWAAWLNYLGRHSIVVYLGFYLPMIVIVPALQASPIGANPSLVGTIALVTTIATSVAVYHVAQRIGFAFLYYRPHWARLLHDASQ